LTIISWFSDAAVRMEGGTEVQIKLDVKEE